MILTFFAFNILGFFVIRRHLSGLDLIIYTWKFRNLFMLYRTTAMVDIRYLIDVYKSINFTLHRIWFHIGD